MGLELALKIPSSRTAVIPERRVGLSGNSRLREDILEYFLVSSFCEKKKLAQGGANRGLHAWSLTARQAFPLRRGAEKRPRRGKSR